MSQDLNRTGQIELRLDILVILTYINSSLAF